MTQAQFQDEQVQRVVEGWKAACDRDEGVIAQLAKLQALKKFVSPSWLLSVPDPNLALDVYEGTLQFAMTTGEVDEKTFTDMTTSGSDSMATTDDGESWGTKTTVALGGDTPGLARNLNALVGGKFGDPEAALFGQVADCAVAAGTAVASGGMTAGGAIGGCGAMLAGGIKYAIDKYVAATEHKTTRTPCDEFKEKVYHLGEYSGRAMDMFTTADRYKEELWKYGLKKGSIEQGKVYFGQMQCMTNIVVNYVKLPGELLGVGSDADKLRCGGGSDLDADEERATKAISKMLAAWTRWETSSGVDTAIRKKTEAKEKAKAEESKASILNEILENTRTLLTESERMARKWL